MNINFKKYELVSLDELKDISGRNFKGSFTIVCSNGDGVLTLVPIKRIDIILNTGCAEIFGDNSKYYILKSLKKHFHEQNNFYNFKYNKDMDGISGEAVKSWTSAKIEMFTNMTIKEKENYFIDLYNAITIGNEAYKLDDKYIDIIIDVLFDTGLLMRVISNDFIKAKNDGNIEQKEFFKLIGVFQKLVNDIDLTIIKYIRQNRKKREYFNDFLNNPLLNANLPVSHAIRVFIMYTDFLFYYNKMCRSGLGGKVRVNFSSYVEYYNKVFKIFKNKKSVDRLEDVFKDGMQELSKLNLEYFAGASSVHDIGKFYDMEYYIAAKNYDIERIKKHLFNSYYMLNRKNQPLKVVYTVAFHHEYYGLGYGPFNSIYEAKKTANPHHYSKNIMSYDVYDVLNCDSIAYFPSKMLEIVDVYDTISHPWFDDQPLQAETIEGALNKMRIYFIEEEVKIDPILFDVFIGYLEELTKRDLSLYSKLKFR